MPIIKNLNVAPYHDDYSPEKKFYRILFKPGQGVQARELTQLQTILQNQIEQFGDNIYKEGSIIRGCNFTTIDNLKYIKLVDGIDPRLYVDRTEIDSINNTTIEFFYEVENADGLKAYIAAASKGYVSKAPNLNTLFVTYMNSVDSTQQKVFAPGETLSIREYRIVKQITVDPLTQTETVTEVSQGGEVVATTTVATALLNPVGDSLGLNVSEGVIFQRGHFLYTDDQTVVLVRYADEEVEGGFKSPHNVSVGFEVDEAIINSYQDPSLLDNANGSENENAPGADRLKLSPILVVRGTTDAEGDETFFALRRYVDGRVTQIRDVSEYNVIGTEIARGRHDTSGDYVTTPFTFDSIRVNSKPYVRVGPGALYAKGFRVENKGNIFLPIEPIDSTTVSTRYGITMARGGYVTVVNMATASGVIDSNRYRQVRLIGADGSAVLGTAFVSGFETESTVSTTAQNTSMPGRAYLFNISMSSGQTFSSVKYLRDVSLPTPNQSNIEIIPTLHEASRSSLLFDVGQSFVSSVSDMSFFIMKTATVTLSTGSSTVTIAPMGAETFTTESARKIMAIGSTNQRLVVTNAQINGSGHLTFDVSQVGGSVTVYYNVRIDPDQPRTKIAETTFIKATYFSSGSNARDKYCLGVSDVYAIESITVDGVDYTDSFALKTGQQLTAYDWSYLVLRNGRPQPPNSSTMTIKMHYYRPGSSGAYNIFVRNSYGSTDLAAPIVEIGDTRWNLGNCIDFRPHRNPVPTFVSASTAASAILLPNTLRVDTAWTDADLSVDSAQHVLPSTDAPHSASISISNGRIDVIAVDVHGEFSIIKGVESKNAYPPQVPSTSTAIARVKVPGSPTLIRSEAMALGRLDQGITIDSVGVKTYTMEDIKKLDDRVERLTYYTILSALEADAQNLSIKDSVGLNRFKNGIIVDPFNDLSLADVSEPAFNASVDFAEKSLAPSVQMYQFDFDVTSASGVKRYSNVAATLDNIEDGVALITQPIATSYRTATSNFYKYSGQGALHPEFDAGYDTTTTPANISINLDQAFSSLINGIQEFVPLTSSQTQRWSSSSTEWVNASQIATTTTTTSTTVARQLQQSGINTNQYVGDFVTDITMKPYIRSRDVKIMMAGLRPNTRHHFFFSGVNVDEHVSPARIVGASDNFDNVIVAGNRGAAIQTDASGTLYAIFYVPASTFLVGEHKLEIKDVADYDAASSASMSSGHLTYRAYDFGVSKSALTVSTRIPTFSVNTSTTTNTVSNRTVQTVWTGGGGEGGDGSGGGDPLAQTFYVKRSMAPDGADCVSLESIDLYFKRKSPTNGVTVMLREVENGYPAAAIVPFSKVHKNTSDVRVSENASQKTTFKFEAPVRLELEKEYAIVIIPDGNDPDFLLFTAKTGQKSLQTGTVRTSDTFDGMLFSSTNNRTWTSYQDEDLSFTLNRSSYIADSGNLVLSIAKPEFMTLGSWAGAFQPNERLYAVAGASATATTTAGSNILRGAGIGSTNFVGDMLTVLEGGATKLVKVLAITDSSTIEVNMVFTSSATVTLTPIVSGEVVFYNSSRPNKIVMQRSTARTGRVFANGARLIGATSGSEATILSVDDGEVSFIMPTVNHARNKLCDVRMVIEAVDPSNVAYAIPYTAGMKASFADRGCVISSTSTDPNRTRDLRIRMYLTSTNMDVSPFVDIETATALVGKYNIDDGELAQYISKIVTLKENFDSNDISAYVTAYRPQGTDIQMFIRVRNQLDPQDVKNNPWIPLTQTTGEFVYSSITNPEDFREYQYAIPNGASSSFFDKDDDELSYTNASGTFTGFRSFQIKIVMKSESVHRVPRLLDYRGIAVE
jgi:hypothetical protein